MIRGTLTQLAAAALLVFIATLSTGYAHNGAKYEPADGKCLMLVGQWADSIGGNANYSNGYYDNVMSNPAPGGITAYTGIAAGKQLLEGIDHEHNTGWGPQHVELFTDSSNYDNSVIHLSVWFAGHEDDVAAGNLDTYIDALGQWMADNDDHLYFLRVGYEYDYQGYSASDYKVAFKRIVDRCKAQGARRRLCHRVRFLTSKYKQLDLRQLLPRRQLCRLGGLFGVYLWYTKQRDCDR